VVNLTIVTVPDRHSSLYLLANRALDGRLPELLAVWAGAGVSRRAAANLLALELGGIYISPATVAKWMAADTPADNGEVAA
jgi:hypothetical protein